MRQRRWKWAVALIAMAAMAAPEVSAQSLGRTKIGGSRPHAARAVGRALSRSAAPRVGRSLGRSGSRGSALSGGRLGRVSRGGSPALGNLGSGPRRGGHGLGQLGNRPFGGRGNGVLGEALREGLQRRYGGYGGYGYGGRGFGDYLRDRDDDVKDAYRDALIANTIVQVAGIIASSPRRYGAAPGYHTAPGYGAPAGHYETHRVKVRDGYWQSEEVWVPEQQDPGTGTIIEGHYEVRKRWVPEVYQETQVWVPHYVGPR